MKKKKIKVVLSGSGTRYPCFVGALIRLEEEGYEIEEICGTSGGAIIAGSIASGYTPQELIALAKKITPEKHRLIDYSFTALIFKWGLIKGNKLESLFEEMAVPKFKDTVIPLHIVTTNLERRYARIFSTKDDPDMSLSKVIRASISIPGVFVPVVIDDELYVDGGITANYVLDIFGTGEDVIGFRFGGGKIASNYKEAPYRKIKGVKSFINANVDAGITANTMEHIEDAVYARTVTLKTTHGGLDFKLTDDDIDEMISEGYNSTDKFFKRNK